MGELSLEHFTIPVLHFFADSNRTEFEGLEAFLIRTTHRRFDQQTPTRTRREFLGSTQRIEHKIHDQCKQDFNLDTTASGFIFFVPWRGNGWYRHVIGL